VRISSRRSIVGAVRPTQEGLVAPITAEQFNVNPAACEWVNGKITPQSGACFSERLMLSDALDRIPRKTYVLATVGALPPMQAVYDRVCGNAQWRTHTVDCGHDIMIDKPVELADILLEAAG